MSADLLSSFIGMTLQATGNNNNAWGTILNGSSLQTLERAIAGNIVRNVTGGTLDLSGSPPPNAVAQALDMVQIFEGALTSNQIVILPNISRVWVVNNQTGGAFQLLLQLPNGTLTNIPQTTTKIVIADGNAALYRLDRYDVGEFVFNTSLTPGVILCNGASVLRTDYPDLYNAIGTTYGSVDSQHFTVPNLTDTGRFLRSSSGSVATGTYQANLNASHTHTGATFSGTTSGESNDHTHTGGGTTGVDSPDHGHNYTGAGGNAIASQTTSGGPLMDNPTTLFSSGANVRHQHAYSFTTSGISADHTHTYSGTTGTIPSSGGTEARPEALAVTISIRY